MKKIHYLIIALLCAVAQGTWAMDYNVDNETDLKAAIVDGANITLTGDIPLGSRIEIGSGKTVTLDLNGKTLSRSLTKETDCGNVIYVNSGCTLTIKDSSGDNSGTITGGWDYSGGGIDNRGTLYFQSGTITGCKATRGAGIHNKGTLTVTGGIITGNSATSECGGIMTSGSISMSGSPVITNNTAKSEANNLFIGESNAVIKTGTFTIGANICLTLYKNNSDRTFTSGYKTNNGNINPCTFFHADDSSSNPVFDGDEVKLETGYTLASDKDKLTSSIKNGAKIKLSADITLSEKLEIGSGKTVTLDLNGHKLDRSLSDNENYGMVIYVNGGTLTINDSSGDNSGSIEGGRSYNGAGILCEKNSTLTIDGGTFTNNNVSRSNDSAGRGGAIFMNSNTTLTVNGGKFENNSAYNGGAIYVDSDATANLNNVVSFTGNTADYCGGTIYNKGTLNINSGSVSGSTAPYGGGIYNTGTVTMTGGTISGCESTTGGGGGIVNIGTVNLSGGTISGNTAKTNGGGIWNGNSGDVHGTLTMTGGSITGNTANDDGGGIWTESTLNMKGEITVNSNTGGNLYLTGVNVINITGAFTTGASIGVTLWRLNRTFTSGYGTYNGNTDPNIYFSNDVSNAVMSTEDGEVNLSMVLAEVASESQLTSAITNGANIKLMGSFTLSNYLGIGDGQQVTFDLNGYTLSRSLSACSDEGNVIRVSEGGMLIVKDSSGKDSGKITGGYATNGGGINNQGILYFEGGTIDNNIGNDCGGIFTTEGGTTYISGGIISNNTSENHGGGVNNHGTTTISGGTITGNHALSNGGGVWTASGQSMTITGGTITKNHSDKNGGGVFVEGGNITMSGNPNITGNDGTNLYLNGGSGVIECNAPFTEGASIGFMLSDINRKFTEGFGDNNSGAQPTDYFTPDDSRFTLSTKDSEIYLGLTYISNESELNVAITNGASIILTADITLSNCLNIGESGSQSVTIDMNNHSLSRNLTAAASDGHVIKLFSGSLTLKNGEISGGWANEGGGVCNYGKTTMNNVTIIGCTAEDNGGAFYSNSGSTYSINNCSFYHNSANKGGALYLGSNSGIMYAKNSTFTDNSSVEDGGAIITYGSLDLTDCTFTDNTAGQDGGSISVEYDCDIHNCTFTGCYAGRNGGAVYANMPTLIDNSTITGNACSNWGGGVYVGRNASSLDGTVTIRDNGATNFYIASSRTLDFTDLSHWPSSNSYVGLSLATYNREITYRYSLQSDRIDPTELFYPDLEAGVTVSKRDGEVYVSLSGYKPYVERSWDSANNRLKSEVKLIANGSVSDLNGASQLSGWYYANKKDTYTNRISIDGDTHLILGSGNTLTCEKGIRIKDGKTLYIHSTLDDYGDLNCTGAGSDHASIGGNNNAVGGHLVIYGGTVTANADHSNGAGIGGGDGDDTGMRSVTIYGGNVTATSKSSAAAIGCGQHNDVKPTVTIYGGKINATGGDYGAGIGGGEDRGNGTVYIYGGTVTAQGGKDGAGIGGGEKGGLDNPVYIYGGTVTATGGDYGAGIGGGEQRGGGKVYIYGGTVSAKAGKQGSGIGGGKKGKGSDVYLYGGTTTVQNVEYGWAIGGGYDCNENGDVHFGSSVCVKKSDGTVVSSGSRKSTVMASGKFTIQGCSHSGTTYRDKDEKYHTVNCSSCEGGDEVHIKGDNGKCTRCGRSLPERALTFYEANASGTGYNTSGTTYYVQEKSQFTFPECSSVPAKMEFAGWLQADSAPESLTADDSEELKKAGDIITLDLFSDDRNYYGRYKLSIWQGEGSGTEDDPYLISTEDDWNMLADRVNNGTSEFSGKFFRMTADVSVSEMVGTNDSKFAGTFDGDGKTLTVNISESGQGAAPFRYINSATIRNLVVSGSVTGGNYHAGGLVGFVYGTSGITNCRVSTNVSVSTLGSGIVGHASTSTLSMSGCVYDGTITNTADKVNDADRSVGGLVGWCDIATFTFTDCLFDGTYERGSSNVEFHPIAVQSSGISRTCIVTNTYYTVAPDDDNDGSNNIVTNDAKYAYTVESITDGLTLDYGTPTTDYGYNGIEAYSFDQGNEETAGGLQYGDKLYTGATTKVTFTPEADQAVSNLAVFKKGDHDTPVAFTDNGNGTYTITMSAYDVEVQSGFTPNTVLLYDTQANTETIDDNHGQYADVTISGRTLYKDGDWNTLCLPFDVTAEQIDFTDHPLHGATIKELDVDGKYNDSGNLDNESGTYQTGFASDGTLYLYFKEASEIKAGMPYIVKWTKPVSYTAYNGKTGVESNASTCSDIVTPEFLFSKIKGSAPDYVESADGKVSFKGNYDPVTLTGGDASNLYLGAGNKLYWPSAARTIKSFRAYFQLHGITAGEPTSGSNGIRAFSLHFGDDSEQTGITTTNYTNFTNSDNSWYSLDGRKLSGKPTAKGIYIYNGKKRVIK